MTERVDVREALTRILQLHPQISAPVAAIKALLEVIRHSPATTMSEFMETLKESSRLLKQSSTHPISISAGCDLFMRFVTLSTSHDITEFQTCRDHLLTSGNFVVEKALMQKRKIVSHSQDFIRDGGVILLHSYSRVVMLLLETAAVVERKRFTVYVTESRPSMSGRRVAEELARLEGVEVTVVYDSAVGYLIDRVDMVLVGAEGVVENGGLINAIGTYQIAMIAKTARKPFYAAAESFKFVRLFPLGQSDLNARSPDDLSSITVASAVGDGAGGGTAIDYTPPQFITLLFTDLGVLTPSGVSDELIKLY